jgi:hypothetical protein
MSFAYAKPPLHFPSWVQGYLAANPSRPDYLLWEFITRSVRELYDQDVPNLEGAVFFALAVSTRAENAVPSPSQWAIYRDMLGKAFLGRMTDAEHMALLEGSGASEDGEDELDKDPDPDAEDDGA